MNAPSYHYSATGDRIEDVDPVDTIPRTDAEILARCAQLRAVLAAARARREAQE
jgi:hypothetical protein